MGVLPLGVLRQLFYVGAPEYFESSLTSWLARRFNIVPVDPDANLLAGLQAGAFGLRHGKVLVVFPEGERSIDGGVKVFRRGAALLAEHLDVPIVPVAIDGMFDIWPRMRPLDWRLLLPWSGHHVRIRFGEPISPDGCGSEELTARIRQSICD
jgi:long-chain acyl-CoA synthetase